MTDMLYNSLGGSYILLTLIKAILTKLKSTQQDAFNLIKSILVEFAWESRVNHAQLVIDFQIQKDLVLTKPNKVQPEQNIVKSVKLET